MNAVIKWAKEHLKTLGAAVGGALVTLLMKFVNGEAPWPQNQQEWINAGLGAIVAGVLAWYPTNKITQKQLDKDPNVIGGIVVDTPPAVQGPTGTVIDGSINITGNPPSGGAASGYPSSWR